MILVIASNFVSSYGIIEFLLLRISSSLTDNKIVFSRFPDSILCVRKSRYSKEDTKTVVTHQTFTIDRTEVSGIMDSAKNPRNKIIQTGMIIVKNKIGMVTIIFKRYVEPYLL